MNKEKLKEDKIPKQSQSLPGKESEMDPKPGPIWTPLIPATFGPEHVESFGKSTTMGRPGQPSEVAPAYLFLSSRDASYISGQAIHVNGGEAVGS